MPWPSYRSPPGHCVYARNANSSQSGSRPSHSTPSPRQLRPSKPEDPLHFLRRSPRYELQLCRVSACDSRLGSHVRHHLHQALLRPIRHVAAAVPVNRPSSNFVLVAPPVPLSCATVHGSRYTGLRPVTKPRPNPCAVPHDLYTRPAHSDPPMASHSSRGNSDQRAYPSRRYPRAPANPASPASPHLHHQCHYLSESSPPRCHTQHQPTRPTPPHFTVRQHAFPAREAAQTPPRHNQSPKQQVVNQ